ncbi:MAG: type II secretion system F family protein, partial [Clostridiales bacterium]|nr:type II secretion system F family protein [Clostridiales bacterium]
MPTFLFRGYDRQERRLYGSLFSPTLARAEEMSARKGAPVTLYESETRFKRREWSRIDPSELAYACRETGAVLDSGALLSEELPLIAKNIKDEQLRLTLTEIGALTARGIAPAGAFSMFGHVFGVFFVHVINSAKAGTPLAETMRSLSVYYEGEARAGEKFKRIFLYPMGRMLLAWNIAFWMTASLIPVANLLLPDAAGAAFETVRRLYSRGWALAATTVFVIAALIILPRFPAVRRYTDSRLVRGRLLRKVSVPWYAGRIARGLGVLFKNKSA